MGLFGSKDNVEDLLYNAMSLMEKNQPKGAISLFNKVLKQESKNTSALFNKGLALNQIKKYSDAITCFDILLDINPKDAQAWNNRGIAMAENGNIQAAAECYDKAIDADPKKTNGQIFNVGFRNQSVNELAYDVKNVIGNDIKIINTKSNDNRSYHVSSDKIKSVLGFETKCTVKDAVQDLKDAFERKLLINTFNNEFFFNIKRMNSIKLK